MGRHGRRVRRSGLHPQRPPSMEVDLETWALAIDEVCRALPASLPPSLPHNLPPCRPPSHSLSFPPSLPPSSTRAPSRSRSLDRSLARSLSLFMHLFLLLSLYFSPSLSLSLSASLHLYLSLSLSLSLSLARSVVFLRRGDFTLNLCRTCYACCPPARPKPASLSRSRPARPGMQRRAGSCSCRMKTRLSRRRAGGTRHR